MTALQASTIDGLCHTLGLRTPFGVAPEPHAPPDVSLLTDEQLTALGVLAQPEAIAVITQHEVVRVIATRGPWLAEHVIDGTTHHFHAADADNAALLLIDRAGFLDPAHALRHVHAPLDVTLGAYRRMSELVRMHDASRARAALVAEGAPADDATGLVAAVAAGITEVSGLGRDGRRFVGCDLAVAGNAETGRWSVPPTEHVDALPRHAFRHPSMTSVRVVVEPVSSDELIDELALVFGDV